MPGLVFGFVRVLRLLTVPLGGFGSVFTSIVVANVFGLSLVDRRVFSWSTVDGVTRFNEVDLEGWR